MRVFGLVALLLVAVGVQGHEGDHNPSLNGLYVGLYGGGGKYTGKPEYDGLTVEVGDTVTTWGGFIGYKRTSGLLTFALEADYMTFSGETELVSDGLDYQITAGVDDTYSINALIGYMAAPNVEVFTRLGYGKTNMKAKYGTLDTPEKKDGSFKMPIAGVGIRFSNETNLGLRFEYRHHFLSSYEMESGNDFDSSGNLFLIGMDYLF